MKQTHSSSWRLRAAKPESQGATNRTPPRDASARPGWLPWLLGARPEPAAGDGFEDTRPLVFGTSGFG